MELCADNVSKRFYRGKGSSNYFLAVKHVSLTVTPGHLTEITGKSGSGKSTLLTMFAGLLSPDEGRILADGKDLYACPDHVRSALLRSRIGFIPQQAAALHAMNVYDNVTLPLTMAGKTVVKDEILTLLDRIGIADLKDAYPDELSGGELRRLSIARALVAHPAFILADEPTGDLDDDHTAIVLSLLRDYAHQGAGVLLVTHEEKAASYADTVFQMTAGILTQSATVSNNVER